MNRLGIFAFAEFPRGVTTRSKKPSISGHASKQFIPKPIYSYAISKETHTTPKGTK
jgi:hypothetical protein